MYSSWSKSNWNRLSFWKYFKLKFLGRKIASAPGGQIFVVTKSKNSAYCRVHHFKVFHFQRPIFHFLGLNWSLKDVKHTILVVQKQLISNKNSLFFLTKYFFQTNKGNVQKHRNMKICCDISDLSVQPIDEICLFSDMTVYNTLWKILMQSLTNTINH